jgi:phospholipase/lecithinase/hemolysin
MVLLLTFGTGRGRGFESPVARWNEILIAAVERFQSLHQDISAIVYDVNSLFHRVLDNPTEYGFDDAESICGENCIWYDDSHPGSAFHKVLAKDFAGLIN